MNKIKLSLLQLSSDGDPISNSIQIEKFLYKTNKFNPDIIFLPECANLMTGDQSHLFKYTTLQKDCPVLKVCIQFAKKYKKFINIGSLLLLKKKNSKKLNNRSFVINPLGKILNFYDKIHLFDVDVNNKEVHRESNFFQRGNKVVCINSPWGKIGLSICYDIRFPNLYRKLIKKGAKIILAPSAFTVPTGKAHWKILLRSRAIENSCYIIATAQCGSHHASRKTYGHSLIVDPWGKIVLEALDKPGVFSTTLDLNLIDSVRARIPSIYHHKI